MKDAEWISNELQQLRKAEIIAVKRLEKAKDDLDKAGAELAEAKEDLAGIRGGIFEFTWQIKYLNENGRLP